MSDVLTIRGATRQFGPRAGIFDLDLSVARGEVHALVGLNGSGKTTLMRALLGMLQTTSGSVHIAGVPLSRVRAEWGEVGHMVERSVAYPELDARTDLSLAIRLKGFAPPRLGTIVDAAISEFHLGEYASVPARRLSQGNLQRLGLAVALAHHPSLIVLDEPTNALDPAGVILLRDTLLQRAQDGAGVLVSSHHLDEVARIADHIWVLNRGRLISTLDPRTPDLERTFFETVHRDDEQAGVRS